MQNLTKKKYAKFESIFFVGLDEQEVWQRRWSVAEEV